MAKHVPVVVADGQDPITKPALEYLARAYGIPPQHVRTIETYSSVGDAQTITVTLFVQREEPTHMGEPVPAPAADVPVAGAMPRDFFQSGDQGLPND